MRTFCCREYHQSRLTTNLNVHYYTKSGFDKEYPKGSAALKKVEEDVEGEYISSLQNLCYQERVNSKYFL